MANTNKRDGARPGAKKAQRHKAKGQDVKAQVREALSIRLPDDPVLRVLLEKLMAKVRKETEEFVDNLEWRLNSVGKISPEDMNLFADFFRLCVAFAQFNRLCWLWPEVSNANKLLLWNHLQQEMKRMDQWMLYAPHVLSGDDEAHALLTLSRLARNSPDKLKAMFVDENPTRILRKLLPIPKKAPTKKQKRKAADREDLYDQAAAIYPAIRATYGRERGERRLALIETAKTVKLPGYSLLTSSKEGQKAAGDKLLKGLDSAIRRRLKR